MPSYEIGQRVKWRAAIRISPWVGVVTGHPRPGFIQTDGKMIVSTSLIDPAVNPALAAQERAIDMNAGEYYRKIETERDALADVVAMQCELIMDMQNTKTPEDNSWFHELEHLLDMWMLDVFGHRADARANRPSLQALIDHIRD